MTKERLNRIEKTCKALKGVGSAFALELVDRVRELEAELAAMHLKAKKEAIRRHHDIRPYRTTAGG